MVLTLDPNLEKVLAEIAKQSALTPEQVALAALRERFLPGESALHPRDEWERLVLGIATDGGTTLSPSALRREELYE